MHAGLMAVDAEWGALRPQLETAFGPFEDAGTVSGAEMFSLPGQLDGINVAVAGGQTYVVDPRMVFTTWDDFTVELSRSLNCLVAAAGAETVSGTFWLLVAEAGSLRRRHWNVTATLTKALDEGEPLPSERTVGLEDVDGRGIFTALTSVGFDPAAYIAPTSQRLRLISRECRFPAAGELAARVGRHTETYGRSDADEWQKSIRVAGRGDGGFDLRAEPDREPRKERSWLHRLPGRR